MQTTSFRCKQMKIKQSWASTKIFGKINQEIKSMKTFSDQLQNSLKKCYDRVDNQRTDTHQLVQATKEDLKDRLGDLDKMYSEQLEEMT